MKHATIGIFAIATLMLVIHFFQKFVSGFGMLESSDAVALLVLAGVAHLIFAPEKAETERPLG